MYGQRRTYGHTGEMLKQLFLGNSMLSRLVQINTVVFLVLKIIGIFTYLLAIGNESSSLPISAIGQYLALPASWHLLASRPWTIITYMFLHEGFFHILFNLIMLYFGGILFTEYLGEKRLLWTYLTGGIVGGLFYMISFNIFPAFAQVKDISMALGASASVLAIIVATATYIPDFTVQLLLFGRVKLKYVAIAFVAIDLLSIQSGNPGGHIAHLGGAFWGFIYAYTLRNKTDLYRFIHHSSYKSRFKTKRSQKSEYQEPGKPLSDEEYNIQKLKRQQKIDAILDKISKSGYSSLSKEEKEFLFKTSKKD